MSYSFSENKVIFSGGEVAEFRYAIGEVFEFDRMLVITIKPSQGDKFNNNVFAYSLYGELLWQIDSNRKFHSFGDIYVGALKNKDNQLVLCNWDGMCDIINPSTGKVLSSYFGK